MPSRIFDECRTDPRIERGHLDRRHQLVRGEREAGAALDAVDSGAAQIAFLLNPCDVEDVVKIATAGEVMPQKSTDFYPKLLSGLTIFKLQD